MKLAILGAGMIVKDVLPVLTQIDEISLEVILSSSRSLEETKNLAATYKIKEVTSDYDSILSNPEIDTVYVALPNHLHYHYAKQALEAGKHVICEKPFTLRERELDELQAVAQEKNLFLLEAITNQYLPNFQVIKDQLANLGDIKIVSCNYSQYSSRYDTFKRGDILPAFDPQKGGGALRDINIYNIHLMVGLFGRPKSVSYAANMEKGVDTSGILSLDYGDFQAICIGAKDSSSTISSTIQGTDGFIRIDGPTNELPSVFVQTGKGKGQVLDKNAGQHRMYAEFVEFNRIITERDVETMAKQFEHSRQVLAIVDEVSPYPLAD
ncbi:TPA: Gfo/Idh/MocA family oxidoreductase [Streptococcus suis]|nr:Gfo/Idh/MocA family oxidoreductase [Streptococcus suis]